MVGFDKERYEDRETATGHPSKGEKAEGRKSGVGLEMVEEESLVYEGGRRRGTAVETRPGSFVSLSRKLG